MSVPIAYIAGEFPAETQTFVYREVRALRERGWSIVTIGLHDSPPLLTPGLTELGAGTIHVYGSGAATTVLKAAKELLRRPVRSTGTLFTALRDALAPGERTSPGQRLKMLAQAIAGLGLAGQLRSRGVRHVHAHFAHSPASVAMYAARQLGGSFSFTGHANDLFQRRTLLGKKLERARFVACISQWHESFYRSIAPQAKPAYHIIRCGVDIDGWKPPQASAAELKSPLRVLTVCRLVEKKGVDLLIRALHAFGQSKQNLWKLTVAGDGPDGETLQALARELGCDDQVRWLGMVTNEKIPALLRETDVFALPCRTDTAGDRDGIPVVLMEAMACGVPAVSGDLPAIRELIDDQISGLLIPEPQSPAGIAAMVEAFSRLATDGDLRHRLAIAGRRRVEEEFSMSRSISALESAFNQMI